ncbi:hypothetical protein [Pseudarthrobacter sp. S9]|uniref:hypothetical protein n=1 Tax=Pseudarthrobacter sp. S9 TaxID=3418421 RepID=UPI003D021882
MGNLTQLEAAPATCKCAVSAYMATLDYEDRVLFTSWLDDEQLEASRISAHLRDQTPSVRLYPDSIRRWRRRECSCRG